MIDRLVLRKLVEARPSALARSVSNATTEKKSEGCLLSLAALNAGFVRYAGHSYSLLGGLPPGTNECWATDEAQSTSGEEFPHAKVIHAATQPGGQADRLRRPLT